MINTTALVLTLAMELGLIYIRSKRPCQPKTKSKPSALSCLTAM